MGERVVVAQPALRARDPRRVWRGGAGAGPESPRQLAWAEPQILIRLPDEDDVTLGPPHTDTLKNSPWVGEWRYRRIYGVECTDAQPSGGSTVLYPSEDAGITPLLQTGDVLEMSPDLLHSGSPNHSADIRIALFFRLLERA